MNHEVIIIDDDDDETMATESTTSISSGLVDVWWPRLEDDSEEVVLELGVKDAQAEGIITKQHRAK